MDEKDQFQLGKVALGDMDCALKLEGQKLLNQRMGNVKWRIPEGQLGKGVGKPSDVFSYALLVSQFLVWPCLNLGDMTTGSQKIVLRKPFSY